MHKENKTTYKHLDATVNVFVGYRYTLKWCTGILKVAKNSKLQKL